MNIEHTPPSYRDMFRIFGRIGLLSFGGPAAQIALMHKELVEDRDWLDEEQFLGALSFCMLLPGPEAMQLATYAGWRKRGTIGGLIAGLLFVLPGAAVILALALSYVVIGDLPVVQAAFLGIKAAVVIVVIQALRKVAAKALRGPMGYALAIAALTAIFMFKLPFPLIIAAAGLIGYIMARTTAPNANNTDKTPRTTHGITAVQSLRTAAIWLALWVMPLLLTAVFDAPFLTEIALYFAQLAVVTFGGAYAVLAWMAQSVVADHGWITAAQMIDALGLAETTPGPLILVTEFVGLLAGFAKGGYGLALVAGALTLWMTFTPCFLWIFLGAPYVEVLLAHPRLSGALHAITAAVVGVIANLTVWFALHVLFGEIRPARFGLAPNVESFDNMAATLTGIAAILLLWRHMNMLVVLAIMAALGIAFGFAESFVI